MNWHPDTINLDNLKVQFKGKPFNQLIKYHLKREKNICTIELDFMKRCFRASTALTNID